MKTNTLLILIGMTAAILFCAQLGGPRPALAVTTATKPSDHLLKVKHAHDNDDNVIWGIKENRNKAFHLLVQTTNQIIEWKNMDSKEMSIIVNNSNYWQTVQGTFGPPTYGPGCATCGEIDTTNGVIQLTFVGASNITNYYYQIVVPDQAKKRIPINDYDSVDATIVWNQSLEKDKDKTP